ncbi:MAG: aldo/keto reductase, partial [Anaerolineae bacterium]
LYAPIVEQPQYNMIYRNRFETEVAPMFDKHGMGTVIWSPLASGLLTGKYDDGVPEDSRLGQLEWLRERLYRDDLVEKVKDLQPIADDLGCSRAELAIAWAMQHPSVTSVILGATKVEQMESNLRAAEVAENITDDVMQAVDAIFDPEFVPA